MYDVQAETAPRGLTMSLRTLFRWTGWTGLDEQAAARIAAANRVPAPSDRELTMARQRLRAGVRRDLDESGHGACS